MNNVSASTLVTVIHGVVAVAIVTSATVLLALHDVDSTTALALYGAALALVGGTTSTLLALRVPPTNDSTGAVGPVQP
jgi:ABC-type nickel/cobalt efflux system permease component RcnA